MDKEQKRLWSVMITEETRDRFNYVRRHKGRTGAAQFREWVDNSYQAIKAKEGRAKA